jgi:hypothetical protein
MSLLRDDILSEVGGWTAEITGNEQIIGEGGELVSEEKLEEHFKELTKTLFSQTYIAQFNVVLETALEYQPAVSKMLNQIALLIRDLGGLTPENKRLLLEITRGLNPATRGAEGAQVFERITDQLKMWRGMINKNIELTPENMDQKVDEIVATAMASNSKIASTLSSENAKTLLKLFMRLLQVGRTEKTHPGTRSGKADRSCTEGFGNQRGTAIR